MRSLIIIEVEHGESTDTLESVIDSIVYPLGSSLLTDVGVKFIDYTVRVDVPTVSNIEELLKPVGTL